jgi:antitoxin ParD1/3/4
VALSERISGFLREDAMADIERLTITLPSDMAVVVKGAVAGGDYASASEVVREALRDWKRKRALQLQELAALKAAVDKGLAAVAERRVQDFNADRIIERGRKLLANRSPSD